MTHINKHLLSLTSTHTASRVIIKKISFDQSVVVAFLELCYERLMRKVAFIHIYRQSFSTVNLSWHEETVFGNEGVLDGTGEDMKAGTFNGV